MPTIDIAPSAQTTGELKATAAHAVSRLHAPATADQVTKLADYLAAVVTELTDRLEKLGQYAPVTDATVKEHRIRAIRAKAATPTPVTFQGTGQIDAKRLIQELRRGGTSYPRADYDAALDKLWDLVTSAPVAATPVATVGAVWLLCRGEYDDAKVLRAYADETQAERDLAFLNEVTVDGYFSLEKVDLV